MLKPSLSCAERCYAKLWQMKQPLWQMLCHLNFGYCVNILWVTGEAATVAYFKPHYDETCWQMLCQGGR